jgi:hypothetical protein
VAKHSTLLADPTALQPQPHRIFEHRDLVLGVESSTMNNQHAATTIELGLVHERLDPQARFLAA